MTLSLEPLPLVVAILAFLLAGFVKGVVGLGLPPVAMGLLTLVLAPADAASLLVVPAFFTNLWQLFAGPSIGPLARRFWPLLACIFVGAPIGAGAMQGGGGAVATVALGVILIAYAVSGLAAVHLHVAPRTERWLGPAVGVATGAVTAATGVSSMPSVAYLGALGLAKDDLIQALGLCFTVGTVALAFALAGTGSFQGAMIGASLAALVPALGGMALGGFVRGRISETVFRRVFFLGLLGLGLHLASRALTG